MPPQHKPAEQQRNRQAQVAADHVDVADGTLEFIIGAHAAPGGKQPQRVEARVLHKRHREEDHQRGRHRPQKPLHLRAEEAHHQENGAVAQLRHQALVADGSHERRPLAAAVEGLGVGPLKGRQRHPGEVGQHQRLGRVEADVPPQLPAQGQDHQRHDDRRRRDRAQDQHALPLGPGDAGKAAVLPQGEQGQPHCTQCSGDHAGPDAGTAGLLHGVITFLGYAELPASRYHILCRIATRPGGGKREFSANTAPSSGEGVNIHRKRRLRL